MSTISLHHIQPWNSCSYFSSSNYSNRLPRWRQPHVRRTRGPSSCGSPITNSPSHSNSANIPSSLVASPCRLISLEGRTYTENKSFLFSIYSTPLDSPISPDTWRQPWMVIAWQVSTRPASPTHYFIVRLHPYSHGDLEFLSYNWRSVSCRLNMCPTLGYPQE